MGVRGEVPVDPYVLEEGARRRQNLETVCVSGTPWNSGPWNQKKGISESRGEEIGRSSRTWMRSGELSKKQGKIFQEQR